jgi:hypothetical protein
MRTASARRGVRPRGDDFRIDEKLSVLARKNGNVPAGTKQDADIAPKRLYRDLWLWRIPSEPFQRDLAEKKVEQGRDMRPQPRPHSKSETDAAKLRWLFWCSSVSSCSVPCTAGAKVTRISARSITRVSHQAMRANRLNLRKYAVPIKVRKQSGDVVQLVRTLPRHRLR